MITTRTRFASIGGIALISIATLALVPWKVTAQDADAEAVAKLKEENAKLRQELEAVRRDAAKMRSDAEQMRKRAVEQRENDPLSERRRAEEHKRSFASDSDAREFEQQRIMENMQAQLEQLRTQFSDENPLVRRQQAQIEKMRADSERRRNPAVAERQREAALQGEMAERQNQLAREQAWNVERKQRAVEKMRAEYLRLQTDLQESRAKYPDDHPEVRNREVALVELEAAMTASQADAELSLKPTPRTTKMASVPATERAVKRHEQQRALLQKEIELAERHVEFVRKALENGKEIPTSVLVAQRELLDAKLQLARLSNSKADERAVLLQQLDVAEHMLRENKKRVEVGTMPPGAEIPFEREVLRIRRHLASLELEDQGH